MEKGIPLSAFTDEMFFAATTARENLALPPEQYGTRILSGIEVNGEWRDAENIQVPDNLKQLNKNR